MCGIIGSINVEKNNIKSLLKNLKHRGPDDNGIFYDNKNQLTLGHTRLSIIDLSNQAHQPMIDISKNYIIVFNGEIYNYQHIRKELKKIGFIFKTNSDTEVILNSYIAWGTKCLNKFRGMFAFCIYNKKRNKLFLARDRFGIKPLIYSFHKKQFYFSSELKPFLNSDLLSKKININAVSDFLRYGSVKQPNTILKNFYTLMPGCYMTVNVSSLAKKIKKYSNYIKESLKCPKILDYKKAVLLTRIYLNDAAKHSMIADVDIGAFLSGGIDSTAVVALMKQYTNKQINTFSVGFKGQTKVIDETAMATKTAKYLNTKHTNIKIDDNYILDIFDDFILSMDQPSIDGINTYIVSKETSKKVKVALSGLGGDEIFAGYQHFAKINKFSAKNKNIFIRLVAYLNKYRPNRFTNNFQFYGMDENNAVILQRTINKELDEILKNNSTVQYKKSNSFNLSSVQKISRQEIDNYLLNTLLRDSDVLSMTHSLEVRPVLLDHKLVEFVFNLPDEFKIRNGKLKSIFVDSVKDIIPEDICHRSKIGFEMPFAKWMNGVLNDNFKKVIENKYAKNIFKANLLNVIKKRIDSRTTKKNDWMIFIFLNWIDKYKIKL